MILFRAFLTYISVSKLCRCKKIGARNTLLTASTSLNELKP